MSQHAPHRVAGTARDPETSASRAIMNAEDMAALLQAKARQHAIGLEVVSDIAMAAMLFMIDRGL